MNFSTVLGKMGLRTWSLLGVGITAICCNLFSSVLEKTLGWLLGLTIPVAIAVAVVLVTVWLLPRGTVVFNLRKHADRPKKGLILLVSNADSALYAIEQHLRRPGSALEKVWLIPSNDKDADKFGGSSRPTADKIHQGCQELARQLGRTLAVTIHPEGVSPYEAQDTYDCVKRMFRKSGYRPAELIFDFTGGTKPMSVGMIMACLPPDRDLEYVSYNPATRTMHGPFLIDYQHRAFDLIG